MPQNDRNSRNRKRRRAYDQARDDRRGGQSTQRRSSAGAGSDLGYSGYAIFLRRPPHHEPQL